MLNFMLILFSTFWHFFICIFSDSEMLKIFKPHKCIKWVLQLLIYVFLLVSYKFPFLHLYSWEAQNNGTTFTYWNHGIMRFGLWLIGCIQQQVLKVRPTFFPTWLRIHQKVGTKFFFNYNACVNFHINEEDLLSENPSLLFFQGYGFWIFNEVVLLFWLA